MIADEPAILGFFGDFVVKIVDQTMKTLDAYGRLVTRSILSQAPLLGPIPLSHNWVEEECFICLL